jgi:L-arabinose isomerase
VMYANTLVRSGTPFAAVTATHSRPRDVELLDRTVRACVAATKVRGQRAMRIGPWIDGYLDVETSAHDLDTIGVTERSVSREELDEAFAAVEASAPDALLAEMARRGWERAAGANDDKSARLALALAALAERERAVMVTVNCHSDFLRWNPQIGISACLGASWLSSRGIPVSCTGDLPAAIALRLAQALSGRALYCEFYAPELETGLMLIAAGGEGDPAWADTSRPVRVEPNEHYPGHNGPGAALSFQLEPGPATVLSLTPTGRGWLLAWATGEVVEARYARMGGPNGMFRFDSGSADEAGARWIASGATHHNALASGRLDLELPVVARMLGLEEVRV